MSIMGYFDKLYRSGLPKDEIRECFCVGPQNGQPLCPCQMRGVVVRDGRYIRTEREIDLGPVVENTRAWSAPGLKGSRK